MYLAQLDAALGRPRRSSDVLDALEGATLESRRAVEEMSYGDFFADLEPREATATSRTSPVPSSHTTQRRAGSYGLSGDVG
jgi:hypothetical protein